MWELMQLSLLTAYVFCGQTNQEDQWLQWKGEKLLLFASQLSGQVDRIKEDASQWTEGHPLKPEDSSFARGCLA